MKKLIVFMLGCVMTTVFAAQNVVEQNVCAQPANWIFAQGFHYQPTLHCKVAHETCVLIDRSGGTINQQDPQKSTYWENVSWTLSKSDIVQNAGTCQRVPLVADSQYCHGVANGQITCAYEYLMHIIS